jgi:ribose 5-phosphate isomerase B
MEYKAVIANDHGAVEIKQRVLAHLEKRGFTVTDLGVGEGEGADYPDQALAACTEYLRGGYDFGVVCCGTGIGISIAANKIDGIRCALPQNIFAARMAREHNNANFLAFGGRIEYEEAVEDMLDAYIDSKFEAGTRHERRVEKIMGLQRNRDGGVE